ncbi:MAG: HAD family hydrolase [Opitutaceae bacterium]
MSRDFDWIFFDCFNTLIDDFDPHGDESGLGSLPEMAVNHGFYPSRAAFVSAYHEVRATTKASGKEMLLSERLSSTLRRSPNAPPETDIANMTAAMSHQWDQEYRRTLRLSPGAAETVQYWSARKQLGVISNFFLPKLPALYIQEFGLAEHFRFILDSAAFGMKKPHPDIFHHALELAGLTQSESSRVLMIGDRLDLDIHAPAQLGFQVLHLNRRATRPNTADTPEGIPRIYAWNEFRDPF